ncbi:MAG: DNA translocase FtsK [Christensenellaceae bacterium]
MKENNEKNKDEKEKNRRAEIVTRESLGAVGVVFSVLALLILFTRSLIFGEIGVTIDYFLLGMFGYCAYPLFLALLYLSVTSVIGKRFIRNRKAAAAIAASVVFLMLILHIALTYKWELSGYISACFKAGKDGIGTATAAGVDRGDFRISACKTDYAYRRFDYIFRAVFTWRLSFRMLRDGRGLWLRSKKKKSPVKPETQAKASAPVSFGEAGYPYGEDRILPRANEPSGQPHERIPVSANAADGRGGAYMQQPAAPYGAPYAPAPEVRQRPGVMLSGGDYAAGNGRVSPAEPSNAFSPFGTFSSPAVRSEPGIPASTENPAGYREYRQSKEFLFGSSPAEIYRKNLIFDSNANVNKKPPVDPDQPTVYDGTFAGSYSAAYAESVNGGDEPARPAKILTDNVRGQDLYAPPYTLRDGGPEPGFGNAATFIPPVSPTVAPVPPFPAEPVPPVRTEPVQTPSVHISRRKPTSAGRAFEAQSPVFPTSPKEEEKDGRGMSSVFGEERKETPPAPAERTRPGFFDIFSPSNPNIYGNGGGADEAQPETLSGGREDFGRISERGNSDVFGRSDKRDELSPFDDRARETEERPLGSKRDIFDDEDDKEDPYSLRSDFSEQRGGMPAEGDPSGAGDVPFGRSSRMDSPRIEDPRMKPSRMDGERNAERRSEAFVEPPCPVPPPAPKPRPRVHKPYRPAPLDYFDCRDVEPDSNAEEVENNKHTILETLDAFKVTDATIASVTYGPTVTRYNVVIPRNISAKKVVSLDQEIAMSLYAAKGVNIYPNFEDGAVSIEVPNKNRQFVQLGCMLTGTALRSPSQLRWSMQWARMSATARFTAISAK